MTDVVKSPKFNPTETVDIQFQEFIKNKSRTRGFNALQYDFELVRAFKHRASYLAYQAYHARVIEKKSWTSIMLSLHRLSRAHSESLLVSSFYDAVFASTPNPAVDDVTLSVLQTLFRLFALFTLDASASEFLVSNALTIEQLQAVTPMIQDLMSKVRPHAVRLVDAWSVPDYLLESALGSYDGDVYNRLFHKAHKENPLNLLTFNPDWRSEEIVMGEGEGNARRRLEALALGVTGHEQSGVTKSKL